MSALRQLSRGIRQSRKGLPLLRSVLKSRIARIFPRLEDTRHFRSENGADFHPNLANGEFSTESFQGRKPAFLRGNWTMCEEKSPIAQTLRLYGGPGRDRTDDLFHAMEARSQTAPQAHKEGTTLLLS